MIKGHCHCNNVQYEIIFLPKDIAHCHCSICRKTSGGIVTTWLTINLKDINILSSIDKLNTYSSSDSCLRMFCNNCGCTLFLWTEKSPNTIDISISTLEESILQKIIVDRHIWYKNKLPWLKLDEHLANENEEIINRND